MHKYLREMESAIKRPGPFQELLRTEISPVDFNSGLVAALMYPEQAHLGGNGTAFDAAQPHAAGVRYATEHFGQRIRGETLYEQLNSSQRLLGNRPSCFVPRATVVIGFIAANHTDNEAERKRLYGTVPEPASRKLADALDEQLNRLEAHIGVALLDGEKLHPYDFIPVNTPNGVQ